MIKAVFIDVDNTLLDFDLCAKESMKSGFEMFSLHFEEWMFERFRVINLAMWKDMEKGLITKEELLLTRWSRVFEDLGLKADGEMMEKHFRHYINEYAIEIDGGFETLEYLHGKYPIYVASNAPYDQQSHRLQKADMLKFIDKVFVSEKIGCPKPKKEFFDACFSEIPFLPEETIMIGDSVSADIVGARNYGMKTLWYNHYNEPTNGVECDHIIYSMHDVKTIL